jgi:hypothetical protein
MSTLRKKGVKLLFFQAVVKKKKFPAAGMVVPWLAAGKLF